MISVARKPVSSSPASSVSVSVSVSASVRTATTTATPPPSATTTPHHHHHHPHPFHSTTTAAATTTSTTTAAAGSMLPSLQTTSMSASTSAAQNVYAPTKPQTARPPAQAQRIHSGRRLAPATGSGPGSGSGAGAGAGSGSGSAGAPPPAVTSSSTSQPDLTSSMGATGTANGSTGSSLSGANSAGAGAAAGAGTGSAATSGGGGYTCAMVLREYASQLTDFEQGEILEYPHVWYWGGKAASGVKVRGSITSTRSNHGYDDERGDYLVTMHDHVGYRYEVVSMLGRGSFGQVAKVLDHKTNAMCALKVIRNKKRFHHQALIEVRILETLRDNDREERYHCVRLLEHFYFRSHLCITFELLSINLYEFIKANHFQGLSLNLIRRFAIQILTSLKYIHALNIIHCDLKPENILLKTPTKSGIKIIDLGSSCFEDERIYTYIQSRFYRSAEVILGIPYGRPIDMWSFGCILAELYTGYPLFPGEDEMEQMACIMEIFGLPPRRMIELSSRRKQFFDEKGFPKIVPNSRGKKRKPASRDLASAIRCNDALFLNFLERCLKWDPAERMTAEEGLRHDWILEALQQSQIQQHPSSTSSSSGTGLSSAMQQSTISGHHNNNNNVSAAAAPASSSSNLSNLLASTSHGNANSSSSGSLKKGAPVPPLSLTNMLPPIVSSSNAPPMVGNAGSGDSTHRGHQHLSHPYHHFHQSHHHHSNHHLHSQHHPFNNSHSINSSNSSHHNNIAISSSSASSSSGLPLMGQNSGSFSARVHGGQLNLGTAAAATGSGSSGASVYNNSAASGSGLVHQSSVGTGIGAAQPRPPPSAALVTARRQAGPVVRDPLHAWMSSRHAAALGSGSSNNKGNYTAR
eukprot:ANDGO_00463.mRNA.1 Dual specificity tyrosine-phosphorylation-regulated kinase 2